MRKVVETDGYLVFKDNKIVTALFNEATRRGYNLNDLHKDYGNEDNKEWEEFYQLIGYSVGGYCELSRVSERQKTWALKKISDDIF